MKKVLIALLITGSLSACQSTPAPANNAQLKAIIDTMVRIRVEKYVQEVLSQRQSQESGSGYNDTHYRKMAREEAERAAGRAAQERQSQEDAILNAQR